MNDKLRERLFNYKFDSALKHITDDTDPWVVRATESLANIFGDVGWAMGGYMDSIVYLALREIGVYEEVIDEPQEGI